MAVDDGGRAPVVPWNRYYRGACAHGTFMALLEHPASAAEVVTSECPTCGPVELTAREPRFPGRT